MTTSYTTSSTFTITHARHLASKIAADLKLCQIYYGQPSDPSIRNYEDELASLLRDGYVSEYEFGYKKDGKRVVCWRYTVRSDGTISADDNPGRVLSWADVSGAVFYNFLNFSLKWFFLSNSDRERVESSLPFRRATVSLPSDGSGYWIRDKSYSSSSVGLSRQTFRPTA